MSAISNRARTNSHCVEQGRWGLDRAAIELAREETRIIFRLFEARVWVSTLSSSNIS